MPFLSSACNHLAAQYPPLERRPSSHICVARVSVSLSPQPAIGLCVDPLQDGNNVSLPLQSVNVTGTIAELLTEVTVTQEYKNIYDCPIEAMYVEQTASLISAQLTRTKLQHTLHVSAVQILLVVVDSRQCMACSLIC